MSLTCAVNVTPQGAEVHSSCISYSSCDANCCTKGAGCKGSLGVSCGTYPNCTATCCNNVYSSCSGTSTGKGGTTCTSCKKDGTCCAALGACCQFTGVPATCNNITCVGMTEANCGACTGCTKAGSCTENSCSGASSSFCSTCKCSTNDFTCTSKTCAAIGTKDLLLCSGCNTCVGNKATISGANDLTSYWSVYVGSIGDFSATDTVSIDSTHTININY